MRTNGLKTILLFLALGLLIIWFLEYRRTNLADSYWLLLFALVSLLTYQLINLRQAGTKQAVNKDQATKDDRSGAARREKQGARATGKKQKRRK